MADDNGQQLPDALLETPPEWLRGEPGECDVVISSRVRVARNLASRAFAPAAEREDRSRILEECRGAVGDQLCGAEIHWLDLRNLSSLSRRLLLERQLISQNLARGKWSSGRGGPAEPRGVAVGGEGQRLSVMINEEDHLRVQVVQHGQGLARALEDVDAVDDALEGRLAFAYSPRFGYLTACPTNVGTGLRLSVMLHLPGLKLTGELEKVKHAAEAMALAVRGFYGEGSQAIGDFFQLSNQTTLGKSERVLLHELDREILPDVLAYEKTAREELLKKRKRWLEDRIYRALGALASVRLLSNEEAMNLLSLARLGVVLGLLESPSLREINALTLNVQPGHLQRTVGHELNQEQRLAARADLVRRVFGRRDE